jgi:hypothetical protein
MTVLALVFIIQNRALNVSASERLRAYHNFAACCKAC